MLSRVVVCFTLARGAFYQLIIYYYVFAGGRPAPVDFASIGGITHENLYSVVSHVVAHVVKALKNLLLIWGVPSEHL